jgi:hypothetical protein
MQAKLDKEKEVYVAIPPGFVKLGKVVKLK